MKESGIIWHLIEAGLIGISAYLLNKFAKYLAKRSKEQKVKSEEWKVLLADKLEILEQNQKDIKYQLYPNGNNSLNDTITRIEKCISVISFGQSSTWNALGIAVWESNEHGSVLHVSSKVLEIIGCTEEEVKNFSWVNKIAPEDRNRIVDGWKVSVENASDFKDTYCFLRPDGKRQKVISHARFLKDKDGKVLRSFGWTDTIGNPF